MRRDITLPWSIVHKIVTSCGELFGYLEDAWAAAWLGGKLAVQSRCLESGLIVEFANEWIGIRDDFP